MRRDYFSRRKLLKMKMRKFLTILFVMAVVPMVALAQHVREQRGAVKVYFRVGETAIDEAYNNNGTSLKEFAESFNISNSGEYTYRGQVSILASTSPEGSKSVNDRIAEQRAKAITEWLKAKTSINWVYKVESINTDWNTLIASVESENVPYKQEVLDIIRNTPEFVEKDGVVINERLNKLKALRSSGPYNWMLRNIFQDMRYATALATIEWELRRTLAVTSAKSVVFSAMGGSDVIKFEKSIMDGFVPAVTCSAPWIHSIKANEDEVSFAVAENTTTESRSATINLNYGGNNYPVVVKQESAAASSSKRKPFYMSIKTNMLYDIAGTPNLSAEFYLGKGFSLSAGYTHAWWQKPEKHWCWRYQAAEASLRWWFGKRARLKPLQGHHIGLNYQILTYDFQFGNKGILAGKPGGTLIDRPSHIVALEYGYSVAIARRLNLDFVIGAGYNWGIFDEYIPIDGHDVWQSTKRRQYFGPTKAEVSLVWLIGYGNYNKGKGKEAKR